MSFNSKLAQKLASKAAVAGDGAAAAPPAINPPAAVAPAVAAAAAAAAPVAAPVAVAAPAPAAAPPAANGTTRPPWADPACQVCKGAGFNKAGSPCRICDATAPQRGVPTSANFVIVPAGDGLIAWESRDGSTGGVSPSPSAGAPVVVQDRTAPTAPPAPAPAPAVAPAPAPKPAPVATPVVPAVASPAAPPAPAEVIEEEIESSGGKTGRPKRGFILCINCVMAKGEERRGSGRGMYHLHEVLKEVSESITAATAATNPNIKCFADIDVFARRDALARNAKAIADKFGTDFVIASGIGTGQSDLRALLDAIRPYAGAEIVGELF